MLGISKHSTMIFWMVRFSAVGPPFILLSRSMGSFVMKSARSGLDAAPTPR
jgi:hypothetical protein